jgi:hypothetical protein
MHDLLRRLQLPFELGIVGSQANSAVRRIGQENFVSPVNIQPL